MKFLTLRENYTGNTRRNLPPLPSLQFQERDPNRNQIFHTLLPAGLFSDNLIFLLGDQSYWRRRWCVVTRCEHDRGTSRAFACRVIGRDADIVGNTFR